MIENIKLPFNLSLLELISLLGFVSLGYSLLYKTTFYYTLGLSWYINTFTTQTLFFSSIKIIFISLPIAILGWGLGRMMNNFNKFLGLFCIFCIFSFLSYCLVTDYFIPFEIIPYIIIFIYVFTMQGDFFIPEKSPYPSKNMEKLYSKKVQLFFKFGKLLRFLVGHLNKAMISLCFVSIFVAAPCLLGKIEAGQILKNKNNLLNEVLLNNDQKSWYIVDSSSDKFLLINNLNNFKFVSSSDIKEFKRIKKNSNYK
ncbi:hypothetical protein [Acinetobacter calcoaceticus]|jgi:hypothetical protein|uniref:hypothetical protein n=1 Tax=Acinetobacter calcoaceticus TaxID=471 RepID=UPI0012BA8A00|nr:hypothetical protein [Acinetobacter calcoaceticus]